MALIGEISDNSTNRTRRDGLTIESGSRHEAFAMNETMVETEVTYTLAHEGKFYSAPMQVVEFLNTSLLFQS